MNVSRQPCFTADFGGREYTENYIFFVVLFLGTVVKAKLIFALIFSHSICLMNRDKLGMLVVLPFMCLT